MDYFYLFLAFTRQNREFRDSSRAHWPRRTRFCGKPVSYTIPSIMRHLAKISRGPMAPRRNMVPRHMASTAGCAPAMDVFLVCHNFVIKIFCPRISIRGLWKNDNNFVISDIHLNCYIPTQQLLKIRYTMCMRLLIIQCSTQLHYSF